MAPSLTVYIDFKSPYAYLAIEPTRRLARELDVSIDWRPHVLDIPSYLGSAKLGGSGEVAEQSRSSDQWSKVKYAYYDCRRYANLGGVTLRGTVKIWDTTLAAIGMLWAKRYGDDALQRYIDGIYVPFWKRELDVEDSAAVERVLAEAGCELDGFRDFCQGEGALENTVIQESAFEQGIFGVPSYVLGEDIYFGREHLPRIAWQLGGSIGAAPDIACEISPTATVTKSEARTLDVGISLDDAESYLAIPGILALAQDSGLDLNWYSLPPRTVARQHNDPDDHSRGARHRRFRMANRERDQSRYLPSALKKADMKQATADLLAQHHIELRPGEVAVAWAGMATMSGYVGSPVFRLGEETFVGRQHLPLIRARVTA